MIRNVLLTLGALAAAVAQFPRGARPRADDGTSR